MLLINGIETSDNPNFEYIKIQKKGGNLTKFFPDKNRPSDCVYFI
ncbi:MAG: hypothetical protein AB8V16_00025 [Coxiella endosymbiont of Dermacentor nuttalli]